ncbi:MAG: type III pantothenate kinase [Pseudomonadota bacterium]
MILELDIGNSRLKWRAIDADGVCGRGSYSHDEFYTDGLDTLAKMTACKRLRVASVADSLKPAINGLANALSLRAEYAESVLQCAGVSNSYVSPAAMGVDRWLAMLAAFSIHRETSSSDRICVIDCGTSLTIDYIAGNGQHEGGLILPGRALLLDSLQRNTEKVLFDPQSNSGQLELGRSTEDAVVNGVLHMMVGAIHESFGMDEQDSGCLFFLCGGDAQWLLPALRAKVTLVPDLVLDGLALSLP